MIVYELVSENLTGLGGPMGSERTWENWRKLFANVEDAMGCAVKDYGKPIHWYTNNGSLCSGDLLRVMYHIHPKDVS